MKKCCYPGSFDPITNGHVEIAIRASKLFDKVVILVADNSQKRYTFTLEERVGMVKETFKDYKNIEVCSTNSLVIEKAKQMGCMCLVRGLRAISDYEYEFSVNATNTFINNEIDTIYFMASTKYSFLSSSTVKELYKFNQDISTLVPKCVLDTWKNKKD